MDEKCETCKYYFPLGEGDQAVVGECRRRAPSLTGTMGHSKTEFPKTGMHDWCGEYVKRHELDPDDVPF